MWKHVDAFRDAAEQLNVSLVGPLEVELASSRVVADMLFPSFGAPKGTLVFPLTDVVPPQAGELSDMGYAVSLLAILGEKHNYSVEQLIEMLSDWGWCGAEDEAPAWIRERDE